VKGGVDRLRLETGCWKELEDAVCVVVVVVVEMDGSGGSAGRYNNASKRRGVEKVHNQPSHDYDWSASW